MSISTCFSVNPNLLILFSPTTQSPSCSCWQCLLFHVPLCIYVQSVSAHRCLSVCMGAFACVQICVGWCCTCNFPFCPLPLTLICLSNVSYICMCVYACVCVWCMHLRVIYFMGHTIHMSRILRLNAFFAIYFVLFEEVCINTSVELYIISK